ncbi:MAG TPA: glycoside hydrolase family 57 protein [Myxococcota bacterium]
MPSVCFYFQVHQPYRLRRYGVFDVGRRHDYFDTKLDEAVLRKVADKCYRPMNALVERLVDETDGRFRAAYSITGSALEQMERWAPDLIESFQRLVATGAIELLAETHSHSLAFLASRDEFDEQVELHASKIEQLFGVRTRVFRNTELIFSNAVARRVHDLGFAGVLAEGADRMLGWRSPHFLYTAKGTPDLPVLLKSYQLSDDVAFRFGNRGWAGWPLTPEKYAGWLHAVNGGGETVNLFMDYETFGEHQWAETGIFEFMRRLPKAVLAHGDMEFATPSEVIARYQPRAELDVNEFVSWADTERDLTAWLGNAMQSSALESLYALRDDVLASRDAQALEDFRRLTTSDHFYYMCTKYFADGDVHKYFSPYESPYEAHIAFMNALSDLASRVGRSGFRAAA